MWIDVNSPPLFDDDECIQLSRGFAMWWPNQVELLDSRRCCELWINEVLAMVLPKNMMKQFPRKEFSLINLHWKSWKANLTYCIHLYTHITSYWVEWTNLSTTENHRTSKTRCKAMIYHHFSFIHCTFLLAKLTQPGPTTQHDFHDLAMSYVPANRYQNVQHARLYCSISICYIIVCKIDWLEIYIARPKC